MVAVHAFAFAVCTLPTGFGNEYHKGDRVVVNKLVRDSFRRGDLVLYYPDWRVTSRYADSPMNIGPRRHHPAGQGPLPHSSALLP